MHAFCLSQTAGCGEPRCPPGRYGQPKTQALPRPDFGLKNSTGRRGGGRDGSRARFAVDSTELARALSSDDRKRRALMQDERRRSA